jgi:Ca2+-binding EF-hand superfamily protein
MPQLYIHISLQETNDVNLQQILDKIRIAVYKNRVRTTEFFKDYDRHKCGLITENQFQCGLALAIGKEAQLGCQEIQSVSEFYKLPNDMVNYKEFCDMLENGELILMNTT